MSNTQKTSYRGAIKEILGDLQDSLPPEVFNLWIEPLQWQRKGNKVFAYIANRFDEAKIRQDYLKDLEAATLKIVPGTQFVLKVIQEPTPIQATLPGVKKIIQKQTFPKDKTFEMFVQERGNQLAFLALREVASGNSPSGSILLYGPSGSGKSHLLYALATEICSNDKSIEFTTAMEFCQDYCKWNNPDIPKNHISLLIDRLTSCDVLLVDAVEELGGGKPGTKTQLYSVIAARTRQGKITITASSLPPKELWKYLGKEGEKLVTTISGIAIKIMPPSKKGLVTKLLSSMDIPIEDEARICIFNALKNSTCHTVESILKSLALRTRLMEEAISLQQVEDFLNDFPIAEPSAKTKPLSADSIATIVAEKYGVSLADLKAKRKGERKVSNARHISIYLVMELLGHTQKKAGGFFNRDHSTARNSHLKIKTRLQRDPSFQEEIALLEKALLSQKK